MEFYCGEKRSSTSVVIISLYVPYTGQTMTVSQQ
jgi:hypothetical protein